MNVDTASSGNVMHELSLAGLKDPLEFKKLVWSMKRASALGGGQVASPSIAAPISSSVFGEG